MNLSGSQVASTERDMSELKKQIRNANVNVDTIVVWCVSVIDSNYGHVLTSAITDTFLPHQSLPQPSDCLPSSAQTVLVHVEKTVYISYCQTFPGGEQTRLRSQGLHSYGES